MKKCVLLVIDGFGIGAMEDVPQVRAQDKTANTCGSILRKHNDIQLPNLINMGLINALGQEIGSFRKVNSANYGYCELMHSDADTFWGHQEIMGSTPKKPMVEPIFHRLEAIVQALRAQSYQVSINRGCILVDEKVVIGDNLEAELGQVYNVTGCLDLIDFDELKYIGQIVRKQSRVSRVIALGGVGVTFHDLLHSMVSKGDCHGLDTPNAGVYGEGYKVVHMGHGVNPKVQVPYLLQQNQIPTTLVGKVADIVTNDSGVSFEELVDSKTILERTLDCIEQYDGFICINIQETDLAGHDENSYSYKQVLELVDSYLPKIQALLTQDDMFIVTADHGNDPTIGHSKHTRENVPLLIRYGSVKGVNLGKRATLSDIGATVCEYFNTQAPENGDSFLPQLTKP